MSRTSAAPTCTATTPGIAVSTTGGIYVSVNRAGSGDCMIAHNNKADWRAGWSIALVRSSANVSSLAPDVNGDMHATLMSTNADPNHSDNIYIKFHDGRWLSARS